MALRLLPLVLSQPLRLQLASVCRRSTLNTLRVKYYSTDSTTTTSASPSSSSLPPVEPQETKGTTKTEEEREADFGFKRVKEGEKEKLVGDVFHQVANTYDLMNDLMSGGVHRLWKDYYVGKLGIVPGVKILDVAGGTGDIAFRHIDIMRQANQMLKKFERKGENVIKSESESEKETVKKGSVVVCDINTSMLEVGKQRAKERDYNEDEITWVHGDAEKLPFEDNTFDAYTIAFGIRNVTHIDKALKEAYRVLKPGGRFLSLEFSKVTNPVVSCAYDTFSFNVIPSIGHMVANDRASYQYLVESIRKFPDQETFLSMIVSAGFKATTYENLTFGVAAIHSGFKI